MEEREETVGTLMTLRPGETFQCYPYDKKPNPKDPKKFNCVVLVNLMECKYPEEQLKEICPDSRELKLCMLYEYHDGWGWIYPDPDFIDSLAKHIYYDIKMVNDPDIIGKWIWCGIYWRKCTQKGEPLTF